MTPETCRRISTLRNFCLLIALAGAALVFAQAQAPAPAKLVVKNAFILTMAAGQREPVKGYLVVGEDGRLLTVSAGDPPPGLQAAQSLDAGGHWVIPGFISAHSHLWQSAFRGLGADQTLMDGSTRSINPPPNTARKTCIGSPWMGRSIICSMASPRPITLTTERRPPAEQIPQ